MRKNKILRSVVLAVVILLSSLILWAQDQPKLNGGEPLTKQDKDYTLSVDVELVQLPISVMDKDGRPVDGHPCP